MLYYMYMYMRLSLMHGAMAAPHTHYPHPTSMRETLRSTLGTSWHQ